MKLSRFVTAVLMLLAAATSVCLTSCGTIEKAEDRPSNVLRASPDPTTAQSGVTAGTVERAGTMGANQSTGPGM